MVQKTELPHGRERILFIDDEQALVDFGRMALQGLGYTVTSTTSSHKALEVFRSRPEEFDMVITDMIMPDMTGFELTREILHLRPNIPVILITGYSEAISPEEAEESGIRKFLMKPIILKDLARVIREVLEEHP